MSHKVHIGYGFHVNCYHSYRGDTNDELGFGGDIRIIRKIIEVLDDCNQKGIPVKGTWDFENAYSLEQILPEYAPDIIEGVSRRARQNGDENIIMGYNNGALSAMTEDEFTASIEWAVSNPKGSGLQDVFGSCERIVRPQEVMFTPSQARLYQKLGIQAVCLYYSCVPFDAFRTIIPQLPDEYAFNPVTYTYGEDSVVILPTYSNSDVIDAGSLRYLACDLHKKQERGEINHDVFLFINMDADAILWESLNLPFPLSKIANTDGIRGLVTEVKDLDFVVYDTPGGYLKNHEPLARVEFCHDTADGNFTGYASWAEKPFNRQIFTRLERARAYARAAGQDADSPSFEDRVLLLSTTHFGLASPVLNVQREQTALKLSERMLQKERDALEPPEEFTIICPEGSTLGTAQVQLRQGYLSNAQALLVCGDGIVSFGAVPMDRYPDGSLKTVFLICRFQAAMPRHTLQFSKRDHLAPDAVLKKSINAPSLQVQLCSHGEVLSVRYCGRQIGGKDFLRQYITYGRERHSFTGKHLEPLYCGGSASGTRVKGEIHLPGEEKPGWFTLDLFTVETVDAVLLQLRVQYPYTKEENQISTQSSALGRNSDMKWEEAVPMQITPHFSGELSVVKRNFMEDISAYPVASFWESVPENRRLASFNHQLTGGLVGLSDGDTGLLLANARQVLGSMASCPMRLTQDGEGNPLVRMNPFGTYYGRQRKHPSRSNGAVGESFVVVAPQACSLAPAYNGAGETSVMALFAYDGLLPEGRVLRDSRAFADGAVVMENEGSPVRAFTGDNVNFQAVRYHQISPDKLKSPIASGVMPGPLKLAKIAVGAFGNIILSQLKTRGKQ